MENSEFPFKEKTEKIGKYTLGRNDIDTWRLVFDGKVILITKHAKKLLDSTKWLDKARFLDSVIELMNRLNFLMVWLIRHQNELCIDLSLSNNSPSMRKYLTCKRRLQ